MSIFRSTIIDAKPRASKLSANQALKTGSPKKRDLSRSNQNEDNASANNVNKDSLFSKTSSGHKIDTTEPKQAKRLDAISPSFSLTNPSANKNVSSLKTTSRDMSVDQSKHTKAQEQISNQHVGKKNKSGIQPPRKPSDESLYVKHLSDKIIIDPQNNKSTFPKNETQMKSVEKKETVSSQRVGKSKSIIDTTEIEGRKQGENHHIPTRVENEAKFGSPSKSEADSTLHSRLDVNPPTEVFSMLTERADSENGEGEKADSERPSKLTVSITKNSEADDPNSYQHQANKVPGFDDSEFLPDIQPILSVESQPIPDAVKVEATADTVITDTPYAHHTEAIPFSEADNSFGFEPPLSTVNANEKHEVRIGQIDVFFGEEQSAKKTSSNYRSSRASIAFASKHMVRRL